MDSWLRGTCQVVLAIGGLLCASRATTLPAPDSASLSRLQIQVVQLSEVRVLTAHSEREIRKPFADESGVGTNAIVGASRAAFVVLGQPEIRPTVHVSWSDIVEVQAPHPQRLLYGTVCALLGAVPAYVLYAGATSAGYTASGIAWGVAITGSGALVGAILGSASPRWETIYPPPRVVEQPKRWRSRLER